MNKLTNRKKYTSLQKLAITAGLTMLLVGLVFLLIPLVDKVLTLSISEDDDSIVTTQQTTEAPVQQDPTMLATLQSIGATELQGLSLKTSDAEKLCGSWAAACYKERDGAHNHTIVSTPEYASNNRTLAHEYLHYVWRKNSLDANKRLTSELIAMYGRTPALQDRINIPSSRYIETGELQPTEIFSFGCTELSSESLGEFITNECKKYLDINQLTPLY